MRGTCWFAVVVALSLAGDVAWAETESGIFESAVSPTPAGQLDQLVFADLASLDVKPVLCSDAVFVRRAYLDVIGTLPTADEARAFLDDPDAGHKRSALIDRLLDRREFADYWSMKWGDMLRIKAEFPVNLWPNAAQAYHRWVRTSIAENKPYNEFVREMLTASGSNFRVGPVNFYRAVQNRTPEGIAAIVALTFMGSRAESWPDDRRSGMAVFFSQIGYKPTSEWKEECVFWDPLHASAVPGNSVPGHDRITTSGQAPGDGSLTRAEPSAHRGPCTAVFPDGTTVELPSNRDPREVFADWLIRAENPWFARNIVNRVWAWLMGHGIIHEPDDIREDNLPSNPELLAYLERELIASNYDLKHLYRLILTSTTYQLSAVSHSDTLEAGYAVYPPRRLEAEVLIDAINQVTGTSDLYTSPIPEPFTYIPRDVRAIALPDGSITSPFLTLFGRSARATGMENERINKPSPSQWLHMLNSGHIQQKLERGPTLKALLTSGRKPAEKVEELYLTILSRRPSREELQSVMEHGQSRRWKNGAAMDIAWALINSTEFLYRH
jgi:hypothetical protein